MRAFLVCALTLVVATAEAALSAVRTCACVDEAVEVLFPLEARTVRKGGRMTPLCPCRDEENGDLRTADTEEVEEENDEVMAASLHARRVLVPLLAPVLHAPFFRYFDVNLEAPCVFWPEHGMCEIRDCGVEPAERALQDTLHRIAHAEDAAADGFVPASPLDGDWTNDADVANQQGNLFIDLISNPEQYTAYRGTGARLIWREIYYNTHLTIHPPGSAAAAAAAAASEAPPDQHERRQTSLDPEEALVLLKAQTATLAGASPQEQLLYRAVSGMQASINTHVTVHHLLEAGRIGGGGGDASVWGVDIDLYRDRVGRHAPRLANLLYVTRLLLRAVALAGDYLLGFPVRIARTSDDTLDAHLADEDAAGAADTVASLRALLATRAQWPLGTGTDAAALFSGPDGLGLELDVRDHMRNISRILDCVGCDRCRLWGKVQVTGIATALRLLYAPDRADALRTLHRQDIVALLQTLGRFTHSLAVVSILTPFLGVDASQ